MKEGLHTKEDGAMFYHFHLEDGDLLGAKPFFDSAVNGIPAEYDGRRFNLVGLEKLEPIAHGANQKALNILVQEITA